jgi:putative flavoprotein involved in K+ transport
VGDQVAEQHDTIVIGAGQAGLAMSNYLSEVGREHIVLERAMVADRWRSQRWDSLMFQFPNWSLQLPGKKYDGPAPAAFSHKDEVRTFIEEYARQIRAPVSTGVEVRALSEERNCYVLATSAGDYRATHVVIATGPYQRARVPPIAAGLPELIAQVHAGDYRNPVQLPPGAVLVVGSGASGCQIAEELLAAGRKVFFAIGRHRRMPRHYRGHDAFWWRRELGMLDITVDEAPVERRQPPLVTGIGGGHTVCIRSYAKDGMTLLGHVQEIRNGTLFLADDLERNLDAGDRTYDDFTATVDRHIEEQGLDSPEEAFSDERATQPAHREMLNLREERIGSVIWATGYAYDFRWVRLPIFDERGLPVQRRGATSVRGIYFLGLSWMHKAKSAFLGGVGEDAQHIAESLE